MTERVLISDRISGFLQSENKIHEMNHVYLDVGFFF